ncbi:hypothetical protein BHE74_00016779 [Ensete ventricosum]|nr:hypothetical protein BHE74_00016779 [Ensete ventricosum]
MSCLHPSRTGGSSYVAVPQLRCFPHPARGPPTPAWACGSRKLSTVPGIIRKVFGTGKIGRNLYRIAPARSDSSSHRRPSLPPSDHATTSIGTFSLGSGDSFFPSVTLRRSR